MTSQQDDASGVTAHPETVMQTTSSTEAAASDVVSPKISENDAPTPRKFSSIKITHMGNSSSNKTPAAVTSPVKMSVKRHITEDKDVSTAACSKKPRTYKEKTESDDNSFEYKSDEETTETDDGDVSSTSDFELIGKKSGAASTTEGTSASFNRPMTRRLTKWPKMYQDDVYVIENEQLNSNEQRRRALGTATSTESAASASTTVVREYAPFARKSTAPIPSQYANNKRLTQTTATTGISDTSDKRQPTLRSTSNGTGQFITSVAGSSYTSQPSTSASAAAFAAASTSPLPKYRHKMVSCKPYALTKGTQCRPYTKDVSTQIDLDDIKLDHTIVPLPVPVNVPLPLCMYQAPMPVPFLIPVPIPVPIFIPTTKKTFDRIERRIRKLRKKLPSDAYEYELVLYAEKLAREEGVAGFEDSSDGESEPEPERPHTKKQTQLPSVEPMQTLQPNEDSLFKWFFGVRVFNTWLQGKMQQIRQQQPTIQRLPDDLLKLKNDELDALLTDFLHEVRKNSGESYAPESHYYLCLGIQYYLDENGRLENIFLDSELFNRFQEALNAITLRYQIRINNEGHIISRIEEEILWECRQLGAHTPAVLLNTILYFNTKNFFIDKVEGHLKLSFSNVKKHAKQNVGPNGEDYGKSIYLRYYKDFQGMEQVIYEQGENLDNPLRCPIQLYNFYLSKCPENVKNRSDIFYLMPEKATLPSSPVWFSGQPLCTKILERMLNRIKMVKEVNELLLAAPPTTDQPML